VPIRARIWQARFTFVSFSHESCKVWLNCLSAEFEYDVILAQFEIMSNMGNASLFGDVGT